MKQFLVNPSDTHCYQARRRIIKKEEEEEQDMTSDEEESEEEVQDNNVKAQQEEDQDEEEENSSDLAIQELCLKVEEEGKFTKILDTLETPITVQAEPTSSLKGTQLKKNYQHA